jgi:gas vesicle protein
MQPRLLTPAPAPDPTKEIVITNNSGVVCCLLTPTLNDPSTPASGVLVYDQNLVLLSTVDGAATVASGSSGTYLLDQYYTDPKTQQQEYATIYDLLVSTADWYCPVANLGVMQILKSFAPQTVAADAVAAMQNAGAFFQTISAYPSSKLSTGFQAAMAGTQSAAGKAADGSANSSANVANAIGDGVNAFFQSTTSYKNVTLANLVAMQSYYQAFPFVWAGYGNKTFYLYASSGGATQFAGTLALSAPAKLDLTLPNAGYTCVFAPAVTPADTTSVAVDTSRQKNLLYGGGLFVDQANPDNPALAVKGLFQVKSQLTLKAGDTAIIPVLTGSVNGLTALGFDQPQKSDNKADSAFWNVLFHPKGGAEIFQSIMTWGGAVMLLAFVGGGLYTIYKWVGGLLAEKQPTLADMFKTQQGAIEKLLQQRADAVASKISDGHQSAPSDPDAAVQEMAAESGAITDQLNSQSLNDGAQSMADSAEALATDELNMTSEQLSALEELGTRIQNIQDALTGATPDTLAEVVDAQMGALRQLQTDMGGFVKTVSGELSQQATQRIADNQTEVQQINDDVQDAAKAQEDLPGESDPPVEPIEL